MIRELVRPATDDEEPAKVDAATDRLRATLAARPVETKAIRAEAPKLGIKDRTLDEAKRRVKVRARKNGLGPWSWFPTDWPWEGPQACGRTGRQSVLERSSPHAHVTHRRRPSRPPCHRLRPPEASTTGLGRGGAESGTGAPVS